MKRAFITGITGQDGWYLSRLLLGKGYQVHGLVRRCARNAGRLEALKALGPVSLHNGDMTDSANVARLLSEIRPDEIYNLAAQSHVSVSFETPGSTSDINASGCLNMLEAIRISGLADTTRFYQAGTSEMFGKAGQSPQTEHTPFCPRSPYAIAKLHAHWMTITYREAYGLFAVNGILFNHESPLRGPEFVTRKITRAVARIRAGLQAKLYLGNLDAARDWGFAGDFAEGMWLMLQQDKPEDYVLATGKTHTVRYFAEQAFAKGGINIRWQGEKGSPDEQGIDTATGKVVIGVDPQYYRPLEVDELCGDASKAHRQLGWKPSVSLDGLIDMMVTADMGETGKIAA